MMEQISLNFEKIKIEYRSEAKFFGFIPRGILVAIDAQMDTKSGEPTVKIKFPWYAFLMSKVSADDIKIGIEEATKNKDKGHKNEIDIESFSFGASNAAHVLLSISETLKAAHGTIPATR
jgi:hypothetical protein